MNHSINETYFKSFAIKNIDRKKVTIYQKIQVQTLLRAGLTYANIRNRRGVSNGCISNVAEKEKLGLPLQNRRGQGRKKLTTDQED